jgi:hypothetical protein
VLRRKSDVATITCTQIQNSPEKMALVAMPANFGAVSQVGFVCCLPESKVWSLDRCIWTRAMLIRRDFLSRVRDTARQGESSVKAFTFLGYSPSYGADNTERAR